MLTRLDSSRRLIPVALGLLALTAVLVLFAWDAAPRVFPARSHDALAAFSLTTIAVAYLAYQLAHRPAPREWVKAILLAIAFLFWAADQWWSSLPWAMLFNDVAIGLFVLDVFLVIAGWPPAAGDESFAETVEDSRAEELQ